MPTPRKGRVLVIPAEADMSRCVTLIEELGYEAVIDDGRPQTDVAKFKRVVAGLPGSHDRLRHLRIASKGVNATHYSQFNSESVLKELRESLSR